MAAASGPADVSARASSGCIRSARLISGRRGSGRCGARRRISSTVVGGTRDGIGERSMRRIARASRTVGPLRAGTDEWPPRPSTRSSTLVVPFSATPIAATGRFTPGNAPCATAPPSSSTSHGRTPRASSSSTAATAAVPGHLLVAPEGQPDVLGRLVPGLQEPLDRLADRGHAPLVVQGAATPDRAVDDLRGERRVLPRCRLVDRDHVEVRHQHHRLVVTPTGPTEEQTVGADPGELEPLVQQGEVAAQLVEQPVERRGVDAGRIAVGDARDADQRLQLRDGPVGHGRQPSRRGRPSRTRDACRGAAR